MKEGILTSILKKGKDQKIPANYRGITVTSVFSKILEHTLQTRLSCIQGESQSERAVCKPGERMPALHAGKELYILQMLISGISGTEPLSVILTVINSQYYNFNES